MVSTPDSHVLIVGAGCFGLSTAYHLLKRGYKNVTVIDRAPELPAADAASTDINKIVRSAYPDVFYTRLAREAIAAWKNREEWGDAYHEYTDKAYENDIAHGARVDLVDTVDAARAYFPDGVTISMTDARGYLNRDGGWAWASKGIQRAMELVTALGGKIVPGKAVAQLLRTDGRATGVRCVDGSTFAADAVVLATGSWSASAFPDLGLEGQCLATGQTVCMLQLTPEEAARYRDCPVYLNFHTGFYVFPPTADGIVKCAIHSGGYVRKVPVDGASSASGISTPRTVVSDGADGLRIPRAAVRLLREELGRIYPELGRKPFVGTRLCWYTDSTNDDWVVGAHPEVENLMLATGALFLPVIGTLVADALEGKLPPDLAPTATPEIRLTLPKDLLLDDLCTPDDLLPPA
ncbi:FAD dependent oxidoreductase [Epithele typhae]|uniref:FAD dependent oxidoreductase n=1 Tax=Epithele typhae TaxID=378194 RepID=UPI002008586B|nr:FAD dependent oxidoreductase [Epithele typhae]KAH9942218.1 FAD dependent oxidoreductase [Epithele typhae]